MAPRVLIVDDEPELRAVLTDLFEMEGSEAVGLGDAASAERKLAEEQFDLAFVDVYLGAEPSGLVLANRIIADYPNTGVVIMTGYADRAEVAATCTSGAYTCIDKPFNLDDVLRVVGMILDEKNATSSQEAA